MADKYGQIQEQTQQLKQGQIFSHQQLLQASLVELPVTQLIDRINTEMNDNPALETAAPGDDEEGGMENSLDTLDAIDNQDTLDDFESRNEREERQSALDDALSAIGRDDEELPVYPSGGAVSEEREEMIYGESVSFYDQLKEQMGEMDMTERERDIMEYLIGSLDDDGLLRKDLYAISDELAIYHNIDVTEQEIAEVLSLLQEFDPAGIGARNLQECLLLQIERRDPSRLKDLMKRVVDNYFEAFTKKHWDKIQASLSLNDEQAAVLFRELRKLNPRPGASLGETVGRSLQQITPDFIVDTQDDGTVTFTLNNGEVPELKVSQSFADSMKEYQTNKEHLSRQTKEALLYIKKKVDAAQGFIEAIKVRRHTLTITMRAIIQLQHQFFVDGDESSLRPMILRDVAKKTGLDLSTVSRVSNSKYALTRWGTFPLRYFFSDGITTESGEELSTRQIKAALRDMVEAEDKRHPMSDDVIKEKLAEMGYPIARRTVAKYREQLGIPIARLRK
jgi:RNA polymerase sigma-54 factor